MTTTGYQASVIHIPDTDKGELLVLINSSNYLEIAVNLGKASEYMRKASDEIIGTRVKVDRIN